MKTLSRHGPVAIIALAYVALAAIYSIVTPVFEAPDEVWHVAYSRYVARAHALPVQGAGRGEEIARQEASQPPLYYVLSAPLIRWLDTNDFEQVAKLNPHAAPGLPHSDGNKNMVVPHPNPVPWRGTILAVHILRFFSIALGLITVICAYAVGKCLWAGSSENRLPLLLAATVAFNPQFIFISSAVNNDNLMTALASLTFLFIVRKTAALPQERVLLRDTILLGVLVGLAALTKLTGVLLCAFICVALVLVYASARAEDNASSMRRMDLARHVVVFCALVVAIAGWWYARNWRLYGDVTGLSPMLQWVGQRRLSMLELISELEGLELSFWGVFGWFNVLLDDWIYTVIQVVQRIAAVGLVLAVARVRLRPGRTLITTRALALSGMWAGLVFIGLVRWTATTPGSQGRLLFPAIIPIGILLLTGLDALLPRQYRLPVLGILVSGLLVLAVVAPFRYIAPTYARPPTIPPAEVVFQNPAYVRYGDEEIELLGFDVDRHAALPGGSVTVTLYLQALRPVQKDYSLFIHLWGRNMEWLGQRDSYPGRGILPTRQMTPDAIIEDRYIVTIAPTATVPARIQFEIGFYEFTSGQRLLATIPDGTTTDVPIVGRMKLASPFAETRSLLPAAWSFGDQVNLVSAEVDIPPNVGAGSTLTVTTTWQAVRRPLYDYTVFLQVLDQKPQLITQNDHQPQRGEYPTSLWDPYEVVRDQRTLTLPSAVAPGRYQIVTGLYLLSSGQRLPVRSDKNPVSKDGAIIAEFTIP